MAYRFFEPVCLQNPLQSFKRPFPNQVAGDVRLAHVINTRTILGLTPEEIVQHVLIFGRSGAGKTNINRILYLEFQRLGIPFLVFDLAKYGARYVKKYIPELSVIRWDKELFFNPLQPPPGVKLSEWLMIFCEIFCEVFGLFAASKSLLIETIESIYQKYDSEKTKAYPTMHDLQKVLVERRKVAVTVKQRVDIDYIDRVRNKITSILISLGNQLNVSEGLQIENILNHHVCFEFVGIAFSEIQVWLVSLIIAWIASFRTVNMQFAGLRHVIFYDEAAHSFGKSTVGDAKESYLFRGIRRSRESGEGLILSDQSIISLDNVVKSNIYTFICLSQSNSKDIKESSELLGVVPPPLDPGYGIIKLAGRFPYAVPVSFPYVEPVYISDSDLDIQNQNDLFLKDLIDRVKIKIEPEIEIQKNEFFQNQGKNNIKDNAIKFLNCVNAHQFKKTKSEIYELSGLGTGTAFRVARECEERGLIEFIKTKFKGKPQYPILTDEGYKSIGVQNKKSQNRGGTGPEHLIYQLCIQERFKSLNPVIELFKGKSIDVGILLNGKLLAIEVELSKVHAIENIEKDFQKAGADFVIVAAGDEKVQNDIIISFSTDLGNFKNKIEITTVSELFKISPDDLLKKLQQRSLF